MVLFIWGPLRIVPVRVTAFSVNEKLFDDLLNPTHAEATITLTVLTPQDLADVHSADEGHRHGRLQLHARAAAGAGGRQPGESAASILGMLPTRF